VKTTLIGCGIVALGAIVVFLYMHRFDRPMLYYYGASPEVAQGRAVPIFNPFRDRKDEHTAEEVIRDLRTNRCEEISSRRLQADPVRICSALRGSTKALLIWEDRRLDGTGLTSSRQLVYDLPECKARLFIYFSLDEAGWGVSTISILR